MIPKHSVPTSQGTNYFYSYDTFPFVIPILVICDWEMNIQGVPRAPKYTKCVRGRMSASVVSLFKTLECLRLLCHPTRFGHTLDHLQGMFLVQCCFPTCCFVTILLEYVAVSSVCIVVMCTSLLSVLTQQDRQQRGTHDNDTDRSYGHILK